VQKKSTFICIFIAALIFIFGFFPNAIETYYSEGLYPIISAGQRAISSFFPFAIGDFLYAIVIIYVIRWLVLFISKKNKARKDLLLLGIKSLNLMLIIYISFKLLWGLNYSRPQINEQLKISSKPYQKEQLLKLSTFLLGKLATLDSAQKPVGYDIEKLAEKSTIAYRQLAATIPFFSYRFEAVKPVTSSWLTSKMGIEGYYNPLSG
jgi:hypothetical protein